MENITVTMLELLCRQEILQGNGKKTVLISSDDEGNEFHTLFCGFMSDPTIIKECYQMGMFHDDNNPKDVIFLGYLANLESCDIDDITVEKLWELCCQERAENKNGEKTILISNDDEGNGFHTLFCGFTTNQDDIRAYYEMGAFHDNNNPEDVILLG